MPVKSSRLTTDAHKSQAATETNQPQITKLVWDPHKEEMVQSELNSVCFRDKLISACQITKGDLYYSVEMFNTTLNGTATVMTKTDVGLPKQTIKCPGLIMNAEHKSVKLAKPCVHSRRAERSKIKPHVLKKEGTTGNS